MNRLTRLPHCRCRVELDGGEAEEGDYIFGGVTNSSPWPASSSWTPGL